MLTDVEIAEKSKLLKISSIAKKLNLKNSDLFMYGDYIAKVKNYNKIIKNGKEGKLVLVTAMSPTKYGIGKTTVSIGLADALNSLGKKSCLALREPSLGPVFGIKGGAAGGGYSQVLPMTDINLNFTGDFDAITAANNLLVALLDSHIFNGNDLNIDPDKIYFHRCLDVNDRSLREISYKITGLNNEFNIVRKDNFSITAASEIMAICCLATDFNDLKHRLGNILVAESKTGKLIFARDLKAEGSMAVLLRNVLSPNLVQTIAHTPAFVHLGPFANIAHGCNSVVATKLAMSLSDYTITEAGFGSDLGAEKFIDLKCRLNGISPNVVVLVATIRGLKFHGGENDENVGNGQLIDNGLENLYHHIDTLKNVFGTNVVVTINKFTTDKESEIEQVISRLRDKGVDAVVNTCFADGGKGATILAEKVLENITDKKVNFAYNLSDSIEQKLTDIVVNVYGGNGIVLSDTAKEKINFLNKNKFDKLPIIVAKTQFSLSDDQSKIGKPTDFEIFVRDLELKSGAGFIVAIAGNMMLMPGLSKTPNAEKIDIKNNGKIVGLS
ncbi:MAG: formate--tetrahydrofolate ligase [Clostridia bacterium]|nr:formate--tetrahydrofolate ligase [Clostridia bacterium]